MNDEWINVWWVNKWMAWIRDEWFMISFNGFKQPNSKWHLIRQLDLYFLTHRQWHTDIKIFTFEHTDSEWHTDIKIFNFEHTDSDTLT